MPNSAELGIQLTKSHALEYLIDRSRKVPLLPPSTRDNLVSAAMRLFYEQGYSNTGVATILREAGVNSGSLYHFFPGKEALLAAVLEKYQELLHPIVLAPQEQKETDPIERVFTLMNWYRDNMKSTLCRMG